MESLGEKDYDYEFFAGLTGDVFAQYYPHGEYRGDGVSDYMLGEGPTWRQWQRPGGFGRRFQLHPRSLTGQAAPGQNYC